MWVQHGQAPHPPPPSIRWRPYPSLTTVSIALCRVGRILAADRCRPVPQAPPCLGGGGGSFRSFHPWERTEVSPLRLLLWCQCSGSADGAVVFMLSGRSWTLICSFSCFGIHTPSTHNSSTPFLFHFSLRRWRRRDRAW